MSNLLEMYKNTVIYKIQCKDEKITDIYIGHTTNFKQRNNVHKNNCNIKTSKGHNYKIYKIIRENGGWDNWNMIIIEEYPCENVNEAKERERYWIEKESSQLNVTIPNRSQKEYSQIYRLVHKEEISEKSKIYRNNNKDKIKEYIESNKEKISFQKKDWYQENKEQILQKAKEHYEENKEKKIEYQKEYVEKNKEKIKSYQDEYREKNKTQLYEKKKIYREKHKQEAYENGKAWREANKEKIQEQKKQIINCECGKQYTFGNKHRHLKSKIHIDYINLCFEKKISNEL
jgi:GIY-YIG catalytic domain